MGTGLGVAIGTGEDAGAVVAAATGIDVAVGGSSGVAVGAAVGDNVTVGAGSVAAVGAASGGVQANPRMTSANRATTTLLTISDALLCCCQRPRAPASPVTPSLSQ